MMVKPILGIPLQGLSVTLPQNQHDNGKSQFFIEDTSSNGRNFLLSCQFSGVYQLSVFISTYHMCYLKMYPGRGDKNHRHWHGLKTNQLLDTGIKVFKLHQKKHIEDLGEFCFTWTVSHPESHWNISGWCESWWASMSKGWPIFPTRYVIFDLVKVS